MVRRRVNSSASEAGAERPSISYYRSHESLLTVTFYVLSANRYSRFARNACLAESAAIGSDAEVRQNVGSRKVIFVG